MARDVPGTASRRADYGTLLLNGYKKSLGNLDQVPEIQATVETFVRDWQKGGNMARWDYKPVGKYGVKQIHVLRNYRVWLAEAAGPPARLIFLEVARKVGGKKQMQSYIQVAVQRARPYWRTSP